MKVIIIYSGKGGVGKTTTTANIAKSLISQNNKVFILDADVNTPSMPIIFKDQNPEELLMVESLGYKTKSTIYVTDSSIRAYLTEAIESINKFKPDFVLIDTPPSITDVHINLLNKIKPSGLIMVTQPNTLSTSDVNRTAHFFKERGVNIIGIVENMRTNKDSNQYSFELLGSIPFEEGFDNAKAFENNKPIYKKITEYLFDSTAVVLKNQKRQLYDETIDIEHVDSLPAEKMGDLKFINLKTWDYIRDILGEMEIHPDRRLQELTTEKVGRLLKHFESDDEAYFMITNAPNTEIPLFPGEIGQGTITTSKAAYGTPCIKYHTESGDVILFANEVLPIKYNDLIDYVDKEKYIVTKSGRYLPPLETLQECEAAYGHRVGFMDGWEDNYSKCLLGEVRDLVVTLEHNDITSGKVKPREHRKKSVIRDLAIKHNVKR